MLEDLGIILSEEVAVILTGLGVGKDDAVDQLTKAALTNVGAQCTTEVLGGDDGGGVHRPEIGELDATLLEDGLTGLPVRLNDIAVFPVDLVVGVNAWRGVDALDGQSCNLRTPLLRRRASCTSRCLGHNFPAP